MPIEKQQETKDTKRNNNNNKNKKRYNNPYELLNRFGAWGAFLYLTAGPNNILIGDVLLLLLLLFFVVFRRRPLILSRLS